MLIDNKKNGKVGDVLKKNITNFTIYAFAKLKKELTKIKELRLLFSTPIFKNNHQKNFLSGEPEEIKFKQKK